MDDALRHDALAYLRTAKAGVARPEKFSPESVFQLVALAVEGFWLSWLESQGAAPPHHGFRHLVLAAEKLQPLPADLKREVLALDQYQKLCEWIPVEPRKAGSEDLPGLVDLAERVRDFTAPARS